MSPPPTNGAANLSASGTSATGTVDAGSTSGDGAVWLVGSEAAGRGVDGGDPELVPVVDPVGTDDWAAAVGDGREAVSSGAPHAASTPTAMRGRVRRFTDGHHNVGLSI